jgi:hypothetical protein
MTTGKEVANMACRITLAFLRVALVFLTNTLVVAIPAAAQQLSNGALKFTLNAEYGSYRLELAEKPHHPDQSCRSIFRS